ncbi:hypothetical protein RhiJN_07044 [Ceratobasidium sp. AG-Ba]|nr:hypothetical protein RhiJN_07044 [Ceratobasidium sp. AG-Ba]
MTTPSRPEHTSIQNDASDSLPPSLAGRAPVACPVKGGEFPQVIPALETHKGRNLILCFDGTGDQYDHDNSNIVRFFQLLKKDDRSKQMVYYQARLGTGVNSRGSANSLFNRISKAVDGAIATGLGTHVRDTEGDRISMFGFSRGAYTARALAGMLHKVGLLPAHNHEQVKFAYHMFKRDDEEGWKMSNGFKRAFSIDVKIDFLGVFDTVNSVGIIPRELPFAKSNYLVRVFRHAVALDELRAMFKENLWGWSTEQEEKLCEGGKHKKYHKPERQGSLGTVWELISGGDNKEDRGRTKERAGSNSPVHRNGYDFASPEERKHQTNVKEVWFAGAHCDVGGGSVRNETPNDLARIPLRWMIRECFLNATGILFHSSELDAIGLDPTSLWPTIKIPNPPDLKKIDMYEDSGHFERHTAEATDPTAADASPCDKLVPAEKVRLWSEQDEKDALQEIHDQLSEKPWWWVLEFWPTRQSYQRRDGTWRTWFSINMGRSRVIRGQKEFPTYVHRSVLYRMQQSVYKPRAELLKEPGPVWVD